MKKTTIIILALLISAIGVVAQVGVNADHSAPDPSSMLDVKSSTKGMLIPRLTSAQRTDISSPAEGLMVFDTDDSYFYYFNGTEWVTIGSGSFDGRWVLNGGTIHRIVGTDTLVTINDDGYTGIGTTKPGGKLEVSGGNLEMDNGNMALNANYLSGDGDDEGIYVDTAGRVGVGRIPTQQRLEVADNVAVYRNKPGIYFYDGGAGYTKMKYDNRNFLRIDPHQNDDGVKFRDRYNNDFLHINNLNNSGIFPTGNVGIGTTSPGEKFEVEFGDTDKDVEIGVGTTDGDVTFFTMRNPDGTKYYITVDDSGNLNASTTKP